MFILDGISGPSSLAPLLPSLSDAVSPDEVGDFVISKISLSLSVLSEQWREGMSLRSHVESMLL